MQYTVVPTEISSDEVEENGYSFSSSQYKRVVIPNPNCILVRDFLSRDLVRSDLGTEVGSVNYLDWSPKFFLKTKALQDHSFLPDIGTESLTTINPKAFINHDLKAGDLIISKDSNIGEIVILDKDQPDWMLCGALYKLPVAKWKYYLLAFIKHQCFREQLDILVPYSSTIRHAKKNFLKCRVPLPNQNQDNVIRFVEVLTQAIINKEKEIKRKHELIHETIRTELENNQKPKKFVYEYPTLEEVKGNGRMDAKLYTHYFKENDYLIKNYKFGFQSIHDLEFEFSRGQNLQVSNIGKSIYTDNYYENFYALMLPKHLSRYGTVDEAQYLGSGKKLKTLKKGDLIFGAEGFEKGRSIVILDDKIKTITNIHGITIHHREGNLLLSLFVKCFLDYLRNIGLIDLFAVGGNGGSLAMKYWDVIPFPNFLEEMQKEVSVLYHNPDIIYQPENTTLDNFLEKDNLYNQTAGIIELDKTAKKIKEKVNETIDRIFKDEPINISFDFLT